jgi:hypothetical protein
VPSFELVYAKHIDLLRITCLKNFLLLVLRFVDSAKLFHKKCKQSLDVYIYYPFCPKIIHLGILWFVILYLLIRCLFSIIICFLAFYCCSFQVEDQRTVYVFAKLQHGDTRFEKTLTYKARYRYHFLLSRTVFSFNWS